MKREQKALPLEGIRVLELGHTVMGPTCGLILADMGAEVIKIERAPNGDNTRRLTGFGRGFFPFLNRNKKSLALDLKADSGKKVLRKLIAHSDVLIENFGPGAVDRLGFSYREVAQINSRIIYCSLKGFMPGPYENRPALDEVVQMMSGLAYMTGPGGRPFRVGASVTDILGGTYGVVGILTALYEREKTGRGQFIIASLYEATAFLMGQHMAYAAVTGEPASPMPERVSSWAVYDRFQSRDGKEVFVGITSDEQWRRFCETFQLYSLKNDESLATNNDRIAQRQMLIAKLQELFNGMDHEQILQMCEKAAIPFAPVARPEELFDDPHLNESGGLLQTNLPGGRTAKLPKIPLRIGKYDFGLRSDPPDVGQGSLDLLRSLGISEEEINRMKVNGSVVSSP
ncbi:MAG: CoA transferase [Deltaproteobacteria bacterium]|nr:CoA transferase [Deltaproteobacteria bacterium]MBW2070075.1 CoA transferase [Deltaproteobacteria bacterium]